MLNLETIKASESKMISTVNKMEARLNMLNVDIALVRGDATRSTEYIREKLDDLHGGCLSFFQNSLKELEEINKQLQAQLQLWESKQFCLSQQVFADDAQTDALTRQRWAHELSKSTKAILELHVKDAKAENNLPKLHACILDGRIEIDLSDVVIPDMAEALSVIENAGRLVAKGAVYAGSASRTGMTAVEKMNLGRNA